MLSRQGDQAFSSFSYGSHALGHIDRNNPTLDDVPLITEHILATTFQHAVDTESTTRPNEIPFFWAAGGTPGRGPIGTFPTKIANCFPNVVQAGHGAGGGASHGYRGEDGVVEGELRAFAHELRVLRRRIPVEGDEAGAGGAVRSRDGVGYVNVDLYTSEGVHRAADLQLLFPTRAYPVAYAHDHPGSAHEGAGSSKTGDSGSATSHDGHAAADAPEDGSVLASTQVHLLESPFLPEMMGLFAPPPSRHGAAGAASPLPRARVFGLFLPTNGRIGLYYAHRKHAALAGVSFLQFVASPSIVVNNYVTRTLSGQWEEGSPVTAAHVEIAKNVLARKVHLWPNQGVQEAVRRLAARYGWQEGALRFRQGLLEKAGGEDNAVSTDVTLGMECMFPPPPEEDAETAAAAPVAKKPEPTELEVETNKIIRERNILDEELFGYVMKVYLDSWKTVP